MDTRACIDSIYKGAARGRGSALAFPIMRTLLALVALAALGRLIVVRIAQGGGWAGSCLKPADARCAS